MWGWLKRVLGFYTGIDATVHALVKVLVQGINFALEHLFSGIKKAWNNFWYGAHHVWWGSQYFSWEVYNAFWQIAYMTMPRLNRADYLNTKLSWRLYETNKSLTWRLFETGKSYAWGLVFSLTKYVVLHVLAPLLALGVKVAWYIVNRINPLWDLVMHPDKLVSWIFWHFITLVETLALTVAKRTTRFFFALFVHNLRTILLILEDAIVSIL